MIFRLNLNHSIKRGLFLVLPLFLCFVVNVNAQTFKSVDDSKAILETEALNTADQNLKSVLKGMVELIDKNYQNMVSESNSMKNLISFTIFEEDQDLQLNLDLVGQFMNADDISQIDLKDYPDADSLCVFLVELLKQ